jgi:heterotetrameric sarcosine oxidase gamma subunit
MAERASAIIAASRAPGLSERRGWSLTQYHAWPERYAQMAEKARVQCGAATSPSPGKAVNGARDALLRIHPQRLWLLTPRDSAIAEKVSVEDGVTLDLSHARSIISVDAGIAEKLLSRFVAIDLRAERFAVDDVAATSLHRVPVVLWRRAEGIDILAPRSFARSIWDALAETAARL